MATDKYGLHMSGSPEAIAHYDRALSHLVRFQPEMVAEAESALQKDPGCVMARVFRAYIGAMSSEWPDTRAAAELLSGAAPTNDRERLHLAAVAAWSGGDMHTAGRILDALLADHPRDLLALAVGHQVDFLTGDARNLRGRVERVRAAYSGADPDASFLDGMWSFGLEEWGDYARAEDAGLRSVAANAADVWGIHAVVHTYEMQGRVAEGIRYLEARRKNWMEGTFFNVHNAWHLAIYLLECEEHARSLAIYDEVVHNEKSAGVAMEMLDGSGLLWRLYLDGVDTGGRFHALAEAWAAKDPLPWYVFNDLHAIMALVGAGRQSEAEALAARLEAFARGEGGSVANRVMVASAGLAAAKGLVAFGRGDDAEVIRQLAPVRHHLSVFGGSHAQRDAYQRTLLAAALRSGERAFAALLLEERLEARPTSVWAWGRQVRLHEMAGEPEKARAVESLRVFHLATHRVALAS
jgi:hypothetical protein